MSELKATTVYDAYWTANSTGQGTGVQVYLKSDVDTAIVEKDKEIARLNDKALQYKVLDKEHCRDLNTQERCFALQIAHQKYKRCLAMADACRGNFLVAEHMIEKEPKNLMWHKRHKHYGRWMMRWLCFAEKFK